MGRLRDATRGLAAITGTCHIGAMRIDYPTISKTIAALTEGETDEVALMATVVCELHHADDRFD
jgi:GAF domain-containing protein